MSEKFRAVGHRYFVDFHAFRVQLFFESDTQMTYTEVNPDALWADPKPSPSRSCPFGTISSW